MSNERSQHNEYYKLTFTIMRTGLQHETMQGNYKYNNHANRMHLIERYVFQI